MIAVPFYIRFLGVEGYGLIGFFGALRVLSNSFLDFGFNATMKLEVARYSASPEKIAHTRDLVRTMEVVYWLIGLVLGIAVCLCAPLISTYWIRSEAFPAHVIRDIVLIMGATLFFQWSLTLYQGALIGLQKIVLLNGINVVVSTLRGLGGILAVWLFPAPIIAYFIWQLILSVFQIAAIMVLVWRNLPPAEHAPRFQTGIVADTWRFALQISASSIFAFFLGQADKVILSKVLTLEGFGYYSLATTLNDQLKMVNIQIAQPIVPRFSALIVQSGVQSLRDLYHKSCQLVSVVIAPVAGTAAFFSYELIYLWTQDAQVAAQVAPIAALLFIGTAFQNFFDIPFAMIMASGWGKLVLARSLSIFLASIPMMIFLSLNYGGVGAAWTWLILNLAQLLALPVIIHLRLLPGEYRRWALSDVGIPVAVSVAVLGIARWLVAKDLAMLESALVLFAVFLITFASALLATKEMRAWAIGNLAACLKARHVS